MASPTTEPWQPVKITPASAIAVIGINFISSLQKETNVGNSIGLRLIDWLKRRRNNFTQDRVNVLSHGKTEPKSTSNIDHALIADINKRASQAQIDGAVNFAGLQDKINEFNRLAAVPNHPLLIANLQTTAT